MTIRSVLILGALGFLGLLSAAFAVTFMSTDQDAAYINLAGRQRMLSQKVTKEALAYLDAPTKDGAKQVEATGKLFTATHTALTGGGQAPTQLDGSAPIDLKGATDAELQKQLADVGEKWKALDAAIQGAVAKTSSRSEALDSLVKKNGILLRKMDEAVRGMAAAGVSADMVNIAGRQRMLSQKLLKELLLLERAPSEELRKATEQTIKLFDVSLKALHHGGSVPLKLDGSIPKLIDGVGENAALISQIEAVESLWADHNDAFKSLFNAKNDLGSDKTAMRTLSVDVLKSMNAAVGIAQRVAEARGQRIRNVNTIAVTGGLVLAILFVFVALGIGRQLRSLREAADEISTGKLDHTVPPGRFGEVRDLSSSLERMRTSLGQAMRMLADDDDDDPLMAS